MKASTAVAAGGALFGVVLYLAGASPDNQRAYLFPKLIAAVMVLLAVILLVRELRGFAIRETLERIPWSKIWPGLAIFVAYMLLAQPVGFYVSSWLAFIAIGVVYSPAGSVIGSTRSCLPVSLGFVAVLYAVFVLLLQVQTPRGALF